MDDLSGGLIYQSDWTAVWHLGAGSSDPSPIVTVPADEQVLVEDVTSVGDSSEIWFTRSRGSTIEDAEQVLERVDFKGGEANVVTQVGSWESGSSVTVGGDVIAVETWAEGFYTFGTMALDGGPMDQPWNPYRAIEEPYTGCDGCPDSLIVTDDGSTVAYLQPAPEKAPILVLLDPHDGNDVHRERLTGLTCCSGGQPEPWIVGIDILGSVAVLNFYEDDRPTFAMWKDLQDSESIWTEYKVRGNARLLRSELQVGLPG